MGKDVVLTYQNCLNGDIWGGIITVWLRSIIQEDLLPEMWRNFHSLDLESVAHKNLTERKNLAKCYLLFSLSFLELLPLWTQQNIKACFWQLVHREHPHYNKDKNRVWGHDRNLSCRLTWEPKRIRGLWPLNAPEIITTLRVAWAEGNP